MKKKLVLFCMIAITAFSVTACAEQAKLAREIGKDAKNGAKVQLFAMDTIMDLQAYGENAEESLADAEKEIHRLEKLFSITSPNSEVTKINEGAGKEPIEISEDTKKLLLSAEDINELTDGAFDITIAPVVKAWGFTEEIHHVPNKEELEHLLTLVDRNSLEVDKEKNTAFLKKEGMAVDLGGIAKGYTSDRVTELLKDQGITSAILSLGGNISAIGLRENGEKWRVAVQDPRNKEEYIGVLNVTDQSVITSGGYQRFFEDNGKIYHHIIDPKTGFPAEEGLLSVTIVSTNGTKADGLSTSLFVMGLEKATEIWRTSHDFEVIFVTDQNKVLVTEGIASSFEFEGEKQGYTYDVIER